MYEIVENGVKLKVLVEGIDFDHPNCNEQYHGITGVSLWDAVKSHNPVMGETMFKVIYKEDLIKNER